jgi:glycosyltransferase involved in cell wall biosynthesis
MQVLYTSANEGPVVLDLDILISNFDANDGWYPPKYRSAIIADMRNDLHDLGWYENTHDYGRYLVLNFAKLRLKVNDDAARECRINGHRDTGRGVCAECGEAL